MLVTKVQLKGLY